MRNYMTWDKDLAFLNDHLIVLLSLRSGIERLVQKRPFWQKALSPARHIFYWPGMSSEMETLVSKCAACAKFHLLKPKASLVSQEIPDLPFHTWLEILSLASKSTVSVTAALKPVLATDGYPEIICADAMSLNSFQFSDFIKQFNVEVIMCSPHHHQSNRLAEKGCHIAEIMLKMAHDLQTDYLNLLVEYWITPLAGFTVSPRHLLVSHILRTTLRTQNDFLKPQLQSDAHTKMLAKQDQ
ncbi:hypothetical protein PR048_014535, partial [Dryococelus australis]